MKKCTLFAALCFGCALILTMAISAPVFAQRAQRTPSAPGGGAQATIYAAATMSAATLNAIGSGAQATLNAVSTMSAATLNAVATNVRGSTGVNTGEGSVTTTFSVSESIVNLAISEALAAAGYPGSTTNLISGGMILIVPNFTVGQLTGTLVVTLAVGVQNSVIDLTLIAATLDGRAVPVTAVDTLLDTVEQTLNAILLEAAGAAVSIRINALIITETAITTTITVDYNATPSTTLPVPQITARPPRRGG